MCKAKLFDSVQGSADCFITNICYIFILWRNHKGFDKVNIKVDLMAMGKAVWKRVDNMNLSYFSLLPSICKRVHLRDGNILPLFLLFCCGNLESPIPLLQQFRMKLPIFGKSHHYQWRADGKLQIPVRMPGMDGFSVGGYQIFH